MLRLRYQLLLLAVVVLAVYYPILSAPLNSVDDPNMYHYLLNTSAFNLSHIFLPGSSGGYYRPLLLLSFVWDKFVWGLEESFMHLDNILLHLGNSLLVLAILRRALLRLGRPLSLVPLVASLVFALHPLNTESVNWISGRTDLLAAFFLLLSVWFLLYRHNSVIFSLMGGLSLLLACLAKETAVFFLPAAMALPLFLREKSGESPSMGELFATHFRYWLIFLLVGSGYFLLRMRALARGDEVVSQVVSHAVSPKPELWLIFSTVLKTVGFYFKKLIIPFPLNFGIIHVSNLYVPVGLLVFMLLVRLFWRRNLPAFFFLAAAAVGSSALLVLWLNITWTPVAERYMYIPCALFVIGGALLYIQNKFLLNYKNNLAVAISVLLGVALAGTLHRNFIWQDNLALFQDTLRKSPDFIPARNQLAIALYQHGRADEAMEILKSFEMKEGMKNLQYGFVNKASALAAEGKFAKARKILNDAMADPGKFEVMILEKMLEVNKLEALRTKSTSAAVYADNVKCLLRLYELTGNAFYQYRLGVIHLHQKNYREAQVAFSVVCKTAPENSYYRKPAEKLAVTLMEKVEPENGRNVK